MLFSHIIVDIMNDAIESNTKKKEVELTDIINYFKSVVRYVLKRWSLLILFGLLGGLTGLTLSFVIQPKYVAKLSFALVDKSASNTGLASLASSLGLSSMLGGGTTGTFSGDNLIEVMKSRYAIEKTLLTTVEYKGERKTLADAYIDVNDLKKDWKKSKNKELRIIGYKSNQDRESFTRTQDSVLFTIYTKFLKSNELKIEKKDKKTNIVNVDFISKDEEFAKLFIENLINQTYEFYKETKTAQSKGNIQIMQHAADSIKMLYENALVNSAGISQVNLNSAMQLALVPRIKQEYNVQLYGAVYAEVLKNLESVKLEMSRETPIFQVIDSPIYPLKKIKIGKAKGIVFGGFAGGVLLVLFFMGKILWDDYLN